MNAKQSTPINGKHPQACPDFIDLLTRYEVTAGEYSQRVAQLRDDIQAISKADLLLLYNRVLVAKTRCARARQALDAHRSEHKC